MNFRIKALLALFHKTPIVSVSSAAQANIIAQQRLSSSSRAITRVMEGVRYPPNAISNILEDLFKPEVKS